MAKSCQSIGKLSKCLLLPSSVLFCDGQNQRTEASAILPYGRIWNADAASARPGWCSGESRGSAADAAADVAADVAANVAADAAADVLLLLMLLLMYARAPGAREKKEEPPGPPSLVLPQPKKRKNAGLFAW